jgi:hypothetical protein
MLTLRVCVSKIAGLMGSYPGEANKTGILALINAVCKFTNNII